MTLDYQPVPCVGCGFCCRQAKCTHALHHAYRLGYGRLGLEEDCPFLVFRDGRHWCGLVLDEAVDTEDLWIGEGCCSSLNSERAKYAGNPTQRSS
jgi:hypothetical protein